VGLGRRIPGRSRYHPPQVFLDAVVVPRGA
jgi:hypothetical protein